MNGWGCANKTLFTKSTQWVGWIWSIGPSGQISGLASENYKNEAFGGIRGYMHVLVQVCTGVHECM